MKNLLVEDHPALTEITCNQLREIHDHEVRPVANGAAALTAIADFRPDLVLLDLHLPDMTGYEVARQLRADERNAVVVVALTGFGSEIHPIHASESGIDAHFRKPMDFELLPTIKRTVRDGQLK